MLAHIRTVAWKADRAAAESGLPAALAQLRRLGLAEFADVMRAMPDPEMRALSCVLPGFPAETMAETAKAQMHDAVSFLRVVAGVWRDLTGSRLRDRTILDVGCGWGRLLRLLPYFSGADQLTGVESDPAALALCRRHGVSGRLLDRLPPRNEVFDLIISDAAFCHLAPAALDGAMAALRAVIADHGVLVIGVRPIEYWSFLAHQGDAEAETMRDRHLQDGIAHRLTSGGEADTSVDLDWFAVRYPQWDVRGTDRGWDELRTLLVLTPR